MVTNAALLVDVHAQPEAAVTVTVPLPPSGPNVVVGWVRLKEHDGAAGVLLLLPHAAMPIIRAPHATDAMNRRKMTIMNALSVSREYTESPLLGFREV